VEKVFLYVAFALLTFGLCGMPNPFRKVARKVEDLPPKVETRPARSSWDLSGENLVKIYVANLEEGAWVKEREIKNSEQMRKFIEAFHLATPAGSKPESPKYRLRLLYGNGNLEEIECFDSVLKWRDGFFLMPATLLDLLKTF
jgi:hypothetical protein